MADIKLKIKILECRYYSDNSGYGVYRFESPYEEGHKNYKAFESDLFTNCSYSTLVGKMPQLNLLQEYTACVEEAYSSKYNSWQFKYVSIDQDIPKDLADKKKFLNFFLTENQTNVLLNEYPNIIEMIVEDNLSDLDLNKTKGIKHTTFNRIKDKIYENYVLMDIINYLASYGITYNKIKKIVDRYGSPFLAKQKIEDNFYILTEVDGFAFKSADQIAIKINPSLKVSEERLLAFIDYVLENIGNSEGHTWITYNQLMGKVRATIPECTKLFKEFIQEKNSNKYYMDDNKIGLKKYYQQELSIVSELNRIDSAENFADRISQCTIDKSIELAENTQGFSYTEQQKEAVLSILNNNVLIIAGKAGSGKTSIVKGIITLLETAYPDKNIAQCSLSAKASRRMYEVTARPAYTIHRLLKWKDGKFTCNENIHLNDDVIIADEFSMNNIYISLSLFKAVKNGAKLVLVFDFAQLPPIGSGAVAYDLLEFSQFKKYKFDKVHRQAEKSGILKDANIIRQMNNPIKKLEPSIVHGDYKDMIYKFMSDRDKIHTYAVQQYLNAVNKFGIDNVMLICPRKDTVMNSVEMFNKTIQKQYNKNQDKLPYGKYEYKKDDKIIHKVNNYEKNVVNGEVGMVSDIIDKKAIVDFGYNIYELMENGIKIKKIIEYHQDELREIQLGYGLTVHSAQGSQSDIVIIILDNTHYTLLDVTMLYTAITRASKKCLLIAEPKAFKQCIKTNKTIVRNTFLKELLQQNI